MKKVILFASLISIMASCSTAIHPTMTDDEIQLINDSPEIMRILSIDNQEDLTILRTPSRNFNIPDINTDEYSTLAKKLIRTLESTDGGVGLAAPQIGINRRVVAVQRVDKEGEPIEVYPNIRIEEFRGETEEGPEGCLSVPDRRGNVPRYRDITIAFTDTDSDMPDQPREIREIVSGFAAVIFQHEVDHLDGILYIDKSTSVTPDSQP